MKLKLSSSESGKFGLIELFVVLVVVLLAVALFLPPVAKRNRRPSQIGCANNLKQIGLAVRLWGGDNGDRPPSQVPASEGGAKEDVERGIISRYFEVMSNELGTPKIVACPADVGRRPATNFASLTSSNLGYFAVPEATESVTNLWLSGDRNLATNKVALKSGRFTMPAKPVLNWTAEQHNKKGYLCFADGRAAYSDDSGKLSQSAADAIRAYSDTTTNSNFQLLIP